MGIDHLPPGLQGYIPSSSSEVEEEAVVISMATVEEGEKKTPTPTMASSSWSMEAVMLPASMVLVQAFTMGALLLSKLALNVGMEPFVLLAYRNLIGAIIVAPFAFYFDRGMLRKVNLRVFGWLSISALLGIVLGIGLYYYGLRATTAAYSVNFLNLIPMVTFTMAVVLRQEKLAGRMKMAGTAICVGGTMVASLYKGPLLRPPWPTHMLRHHPAATVPAAHHNMGLGTVYLCGSCVAYALWFIVQARVGREFPCKYLSTVLACVSGTLQALLIGAAVTFFQAGGGSAASWRLGWNLQLAAVVYMGAFNTGATFCLMSWAIARRGPIYPSMFNSLSLVATTVLDSLLLGTLVSVGSLLGTLLIVVGLYVFLRGKATEVHQQQQQNLITLVKFIHSSSM
ncbi:WAT1-related protein At5g64700-like [Setaria italica]|uniref:WAT1-related protein At5g64700-like n=1 Tax=Setaria italica TaxID=4555 RepID=UPI000BE4C580|nr:WAT1-related protein At5g64700-like [Setaria italica]